MKCPKCEREIADKALFCGYCGATIPKVAERGPEPEQEKPKNQNEQGNTPLTGTENGTPVLSSNDLPKKEKKKKGRGLKILLAFSLLAVIAGGVLGFVVAKGIVDWRDYLPKDNFVWSGTTTGVPEIAEESDVPEDSGEKKEMEPAEKEEVQLPEESQGSEQEDLTISDTDVPASAEESDVPEESGEETEMEPTESEEAPLPEESQGGEQEDLTISDTEDSANTINEGGKNNETVSQM